MFLDHLRRDGPLTQIQSTLEILKHGVPLGVEVPPLRSPDIWPTKEELKGEQHGDVNEDPKGRENYSSAELHAEDIRRTFMEERDFDMVMGPFTAEQLGSGGLWMSRSFVRDQWQPSMKGTRCKLSMTAPGQEPMHIFKPMGRRVMGCLHGIHWLQASQQEPGHKKLPYAHWEWPRKGDQWMLLKADVRYNPRSGSTKLHN